MICFGGQLVRLQRVYRGLDETGHGGGTVGGPTSQVDRHGAVAGRLGVVLQCMDVLEGGLSPRVVEVAQVGVLLVFQRRVWRLLQRIRVELTSILYSFS